MPVISRFLGIVIIMLWERGSRHHKPHFHAKYNEYKCTVSIPELEILEGKLPQRAMTHVIEWAKLHLSELQDNWKCVMENKPLKQIAPLE